MDIEQLISSYLDGDLSGDQEAELHHTLALSPEARALFREHIALQRVARDERVLHRPSESMRSTLFARLQNEGMERSAAFPVGAVIAPPVVATLLSDGAPTADVMSEPRPDLPVVTRNTSATPIEMRPPIARASEQHDEDRRRRRRLIPILIPLMLCAIVGGTFWFGGGLDMTKTKNPRDFGATAQTEGKVDKEASAATTAPPASGEVSDVADATETPTSTTDASPATTAQGSGGGALAARSSRREGGGAQGGRRATSPRGGASTSAPESEMIASSLSHTEESHTEEPVSNPGRRIRSNEPPTIPPSFDNDATSSVYDGSDVSQDASPALALGKPRVNHDVEPVQDYGDLQDGDDASDNSITSASSPNTEYDETDEGLASEQSMNGLSQQSDYASPQTPMEEGSGVLTIDGGGSGPMTVLQLWDTNSNKPIHVNRNNAAAVAATLELLADYGITQDADGGYSFSEDLFDPMTRESSFLVNDQDGTHQYYVAQGDGDPSTESIVLDANAMAEIAQGREPLDVIGNMRGRHTALPATTPSGNTMSDDKGDDKEKDADMTTASATNDVAAGKKVPPAPALASANEKSSEQQDAPLDALVISDDEGFDIDRDDVHRFSFGVEGGVEMSLSPVAETNLLSGVNTGTIERMAALSEVKVAGGAMVGPKHRHRIYGVVGLSAYNEREQVRRREMTRSVDAGGNVTFATTVNVSDRIRAAQEVWGGVGYRITIPITAKWSSGADLSAGVGTKYLRIEFVLPLSYSITDNIRLELTPGLRYRTVHGTVEPTVTGTLDPSAPSSFTEEGLIVPADESELSLGAGFGLILLMR